MTTLDVARDMVAKLEAQLPPDATATTDPRGVTPPCVLVEHLDATRNGMCSVTVTWQVVALASGPFNVDAWATLDDLAAAVWATLDVERYDRVAYRLAPDVPPLPAYLFRFSGGVDL